VPPLPRADRRWILQNPAAAAADRHPPRWIGRPRGGSMANRYAMGFGPGIASFSYRKANR